MTVATEVSYAERSWTGAENDFAPGMSAQNTADIKVTYKDALSVLTVLTAGVHYAIQKAGDAGMTGAVSIQPLNMPPAPGMVIIERTTPATQQVDFESLEDFDPATHTRLHDAAALRAAELRNKQARAVTPFTAFDAYVDYRPLRIAAADPVNDEDLTTKSYVLQITGILNLQNYVTQAQQAAADAQGAKTGAQTAETSAEAARDKAQLWSDQAEDTPVQAAEYSAYHWSRKAAASAAAILPLLSNLDDGLFGDVDTGNIDDGAF